MLSAVEVDKTEHAEKYDALCSMMTSGQTSFKFTVVSEPANDEDDEEAECEEIGDDSFVFIKIFLPKILLNL